MSKGKKTLQTRSSRGWLLGSLVLALCIFWALGPVSSQWIETIYSRKIYPGLSSLIMSITEALPFSLATVLLITLPLLWIIISLRSFQKRQSPWWLAYWLWRTLLALAIIYALFVIFWGANYRREPIEQLFRLTEQTTSQEDVEVLAKSLQTIVETNLNAESNMAVANSAIQDSLSNLYFDITGVSIILPEVKRLPPGWLILSGRASGVVSPWTLEAHVDGALPEVSFIAVGAHELAHLIGIAGEADADFVAAVAGLKANDAYARYAVALRLWWEAVATLPAQTQKDYLENLPPKARADLESSFEPYRRYRLPNWIQNFQQKSYNQYLRSQGVEAGIADYSRIVNLLVRAQKQKLLELP